MIGLTSGLLAVLFVALVGTLLVSIRRRADAAAVNAAASILVAALSLVVASGAVPPGEGVAFDPTLPLWVTTAGVLHVMGMLGSYESIWWWDHLTHTVSAALVAALLYAAFLVTAGNGAVPALSSAELAAATVLGTLAVGVFWELLELVARAVGERFGVDPILVVYGRRDTALDLVFDVVGAILVVALNARLFVEYLGDAPELTRTLLVWTGGVVLVGSTLIVMSLGALGDLTADEGEA
jgi:hypothetical protein